MERAYKNIRYCRACNSDNISHILSLGRQSVVGFSSTKREPIFTPLDLVLCGDCKLLQLKQTTNPELLWNSEYGYRSGINQSVRDELKDVVCTIEKIQDLSDGDIVIDIGCNDGTLLDSYTSSNIIRVGFDPSHNVISIANQLLSKYSEENYLLIPDFFTCLPYLRRFKKKAKVITAIAMFYDLNDPNTFLNDVSEVLDDEGIFVIQQNYLVGMLSQNAVDNILHEHLEYFSLSSLTNLLAKHNMEIFNVLETPLNGGSFRTYIQKVGKGMHKIDKSVNKTMQMENSIGIDNINTYIEFANRLKHIGKHLHDFIAREVKSGKKVYAYAASTRGNSLLQFAHLDNNLITKAAERNPYKWGKITVGTNIPIVSEDEAREDKPDYFLVLPWYFREEFIRREEKYLKSGGKFIFPLPEFEIYPQ